MRVSDLILCVVLLSITPSGSSGWYLQPTATTTTYRKAITDEDMEAAVIDAHDLSDPGIEAASMEAAVVLAADLAEEQMKKHDEHEKNVSFYFNNMKSMFQTFSRRHLYNDLAKLKDAEAKFATDLSNVAAVEHVEEEELQEENERGEYGEKGDDTVYAKNNDETILRAISVEDHYKSMDRDIKTIERLIKEADQADRSEGHSLERTFNDEDASDLALMMLEKSVLAATDKLELCQIKAAETEYVVKEALEAKYTAKALSESIERERRAAEMRYLSTEHYEDDVDVMERKRDSSIMHANNDLLAQALQQEKDAEVKLEQTIESDILAKKELEQMIENKSILKQEFHDLEKIIHDHTLTLMKEEAAKNPEKGENHHFQWWHKRW